MAVQSAGDQAEPDELGFGGLLRRHRRAAGLSQEDLADRAGLSVDAIAALERGRRRAPRPLTARLLARALTLDDVARTAFLSAAAGESAAAAAVWTPPPAPTSELVGRAGELADAVLRLTETQTRLLTLTGPGGVGKTRLAVALAAPSAERLGADVAWVSLEPLVAGSSVAATIATSIGLRPVPGQDPLDLIAGSIGDRRVLLVLDNCEHLVENSASLVASLMRRCGQLHILATSRELLGVPGEAVQLVGPLSVPPADCPAEHLVGSPAVRLFITRASERGVQAMDQGLPEVARVVRRLDGIPLAIELAAARLNVLTISQIADELDESFQILRAGERAGPLRHRTMRRAVAWSYDLLDERDQRCLAALSVFVGGWTRDAAEAVCADVLGDDASSDPEPDLIDLLGRLVDRSLVLVRRGGSAARYDILTAIRDYANHQLVELGSADEVARRHADHFATFVETADAELRDAAQAAALDRVSAELDNLRAAIHWSVDHHEVELALRLAGASWNFCYLRGHYSEGREWLESALELGEGGFWRSRANAMVGAGMLAFLQCEYDVATRRIEAAHDEFGAHHDRAGMALCLHRLGSIARERADYDRATELHRQSRRLYVDLDDRSGMAWTDNYLGFVGWLRGDLDEAARCCGAALAAFRDIGDGEGIAWSLINLGVVALNRAELDLAESRLSESLDLSQRLGYREGVAWSLNLLGVVEMRRGRTARAVHLLDESLAEHRDLGDRWRMASVLEALAEVAAARRRGEYAAYLLGAATAIRTEIGAPIPASEVATRDACISSIRSALDPASFDAAWRAGSETPAYAVVEGYPPTLDGPPRVEGPDPDPSS